FPADSPWNAYARALLPQVLQTPGQQVYDTVMYYNLNPVERHAETFKKDMYRVMKSAFDQAKAAADEAKKHNLNGDAEAPGQDGDFFSQPVGGFTERNEIIDSTKLIDPHTILTFGEGSAEQDLPTRYAGIIGKYGSSSGKPLDIKL